MTVPNSVHKPQFSPYEKNARVLPAAKKSRSWGHRRRSGVRPPPLSPTDWRVIPRCATACSLKSCDFTGTTAASCHTHRGYARPPTSRELGMVQIRGRKAHRPSADDLGQNSAQGGQSSEQTPEQPKETSSTIAVLVTGDAWDKFFAPEQKSCSLSPGKLFSLTARQL